MEMYIGLGIITILLIIVILVAMKMLGDMLTNTQKQTSEIQDKRLAELNEQITLRNDTLQKTINDMLVQVDKHLSSIQDLWRWLNTSLLNRFRKTELRISTPRL